jgi:uncharacterized HAD superfamily protein
MRIGLDIDNVVLDTFSSFLRYYNLKYGAGFKLEDLTSYYLWEVGIGGDKEESIRLMDGFFNSSEILDVPFIEGAEEGIKKLIKNNEIYFVTSRLASHRGISEVFVNRNFPDLSGRLIFTNDFSGSNGKSKAEVCEQLEICCYVEDCYDYLLAFKVKGIKSLLLRWPWNEVEWQRLKGQSDLIVPVENWDEILEEIGKLKGKND